ncbi:MAG: sugar transferase [Bacteroidetes bacterium]|nr:sugar transferase [Bacteroidota bacterium]
MQHLRRKLLFELYKLLDAGIMLVVLAFVIVFFSLDSKDHLPDFFVFFSYHIKLINVVLLGMLIFIWPAIFSSFGLYKSQRLGIINNEFLKILKAVGVGTMLFATMSLILSREDITIRTVIVFWLICSTATFATRFTLKNILFQLRKHGRNLRNIVIVGKGKRGHILASKLVKKKESGYRLLGFVDERTDGEDDHPQGNLVATLDKFPKFLGDHVVDEVFIALPMKSYYSKISDVIHACEEQGVPVHIPVDFFNTGQIKIKTVVLDEMPFILHNARQSEDLNALLLKRGVDILVSIFLLILFLPLFLLISVLIKLSSKGPVFFVQERVGYNKRVFRLLKFRTMVEDAEVQQATIEHLNEAEGAIFKIRNDPRITPLGKVLRKTSLDELPQLVNVLRGYMSLVGPRPLPIRDVKRIDAQWVKRRFSVRPGITGLWQINGRSEVGFGQLVQYDLEYIDNWSPWLDVKIIFKTIPAVIGGFGAT